MQYIRRLIYIHVLCIYIQLYTHSSVNIHIHVHALYLKTIYYSCKHLQYKLLTLTMAGGGRSIFNLVSLLLSMAAMI